MDKWNLLFLIEFIGIFGGFMLFGFWQLRKLDQLDAEEAAEKNKAEQRDQ